ncbi:MAG: BON domain-containing protein [Chloroflexota bacterium]|nr:BON domain-containing protein [Chloroflexota bacterium]
MSGAPWPVRAPHTTERKQVMIGEMIAEAGKAIEPTDRAVANAVADTIARDIPYPMPHIDVLVEDGHVTLHGVATCDLERHAAENAARRTRGVRSVANRIAHAR